MKTFSLSLLLAFALNMSAQVTAFYFTSSPQSLVGEGQTMLIQQNEGFTISASQNDWNGVSLSIASTAPGSPWWFLDFSAPNDAQLTVGTYLDAGRLAFQGPDSPGLDFSGNGRGDNTLTGYFTVLDIQYGVGSTIQSFAADFVQYDDGNLDEWNQGSIRYNSTVPIPEPSTCVFVIAGGLAFLVLRERKYATAA